MKKTLVYYLFSLSFPLLFLTSNQNTPCIVTPPVKCPTKYPLSVFADPSVTEDDLRIAEAKLGLPINEGPEFWSSIANDQRFSDFHRGCCVIQLFKRHVRSGMRLKDLTSMFAGGKWLHKPEQIDHFIVVAGFVPVKWTLSDSLFSIHVCLGQSCGTVYLVTEGKIETNDLANQIRGIAGNPGVGILRIVDCWPK